MDIISAYREVSTFRGAAAVCGTPDKTVKRVIARHETGGDTPERVARERNYAGVVELVAEKVNKTAGRISAKRLLPAARAQGYGGSTRNFRRFGVGAETVVASGESSWSSSGGVVAG